MLVARSQAPLRAAAETGKAQAAFDTRVERLRLLVRDTEENCRRVDAAVMRLSGLSPPHGSEGEAKEGPSDVLGKIDVALDDLLNANKLANEHLNRLESL